ncbi:hypothetical protein BHM03_00018552, partial [Ensete ventricosum]
MRTDRYYRVVLLKSIVDGRLMKKSTVDGRLKKKKGKEEEEKKKKYLAAVFACALPACPRRPRVDREPLSPSPPAGRSRD